MPTTSETLNFDTFLTLTLKNYESKLNKNFLEYRPAVKVLFDDYSHQDTGGGRTWQGIAEYGQANSVKFFNGADTFAQDPSQTAQPIRYDWKYMGGSVSMTDIELVENSGPAKLADILQTRIDQVLRTANILIGNEIFSDGTNYNGNTFTGLAAAVQAASPPTNTVGGLSATTFPFWRNNYTSIGSWAANGVNGATTDSVLTLFNNCTDGMTKRPTAIISDQATWEKYNKTLLATLRYVSSDGTYEKSDMGFKKFMGLQYQGIPWYWDRQCPAGTLYMLNAEDIHFMVDPKMKWKWTEPRSYPNQLTYTRIVSLRTFLCTRTRMFLGVGTGIVA